MEMTDEKWMQKIVWLLKVICGKIAAEQLQIAPQDEIYRAAEMKFEMRLPLNHQD